MIVKKYLKLINIENSEFLILRINNGNTGSGGDAHLRIDRTNHSAGGKYGINASYTYYKYLNANDTARVYFTPDDNSANAYGGADYFKFAGHLVG